MIAIAAARRGPRHRRVFAFVIAALAIAAWFALWAWQRSPYGRWLDHGDWTSSGPAAALCSLVPGGTWLVPAAVTASAWVLMIAAMMLPTTLPLVDSVERMTRGRGDGARLLCLVVIGYVAVWGAFGLVAHGADAGLRKVFAESSWLADRAHWVGIAVITLAGAFQFSTLKYRCLDKCRTPLSFVIEHWHGIAPQRDALALGARHGVFCIGCCWALMLLMFAVGTGSLGWMLVLATLMAVEKNLPWGRRLSAPLGAVLLGWAAVLAFIGR
jgi:predicted metal-binding membrane protein